MIVSKRHKKIPLTTRVINRIEEVPRDAWNSVFPDVLESYDFFRTIDDSSLEQFSFRYILVYDRARLVGAAPCFLMDYSLDTSVNGPLRRLSNAVKKINPRIFSLKAFICGMPLGPGRIGAAGDLAAVVEAIVRRMERLARRERCAIVAFKDFERSYMDVLDRLQKEGFSKFDSLPTTEMRVTFKDFEEYLKTLSGASRYDLRRKFKKVDGRVPLTLEITDTLDEATLADVYRLYLAIVDKHDMGFELLPVAFFRNLPTYMTGRVKYFLWRVDGKLAAFLLCLVSEKRLIDYYVGLDYSVAHTYHLYFIKFRDVMNWCIRHGIREYEMGITGYEPKRRLGFTFVPLYLYARLRNRALRPIFSFICQFLKFENFDPSLKEVRKAMAR